MRKRSMHLIPLFAILALLMSSVGPVGASPQTRPGGTLALAAPAGPAAPHVMRANHLVQLHDPAAHRQTAPLEVLAAPGVSTVGWTTILTDSFESFPLGWTLVHTSTLDQLWGSTTVTADTEYNPASLKSVWPAVAGADAVDPAGGNYPNNLDSWMIRGPIDLSGWQAAELDFAINYDIEEGDWVGFCVATFPAEPAPTDFHHDEDCSWISGQSNGWEFDYINLNGFTGATDVYIAFAFQSDGNNAEPHAGPFIDELALWVNADRVKHYDSYGHFVDYEQIVTESFDSVVLDSDPLWKAVSTPAGTGWVTTDDANDNAVNPLSTKSVSPTPGNSYSAGQRSWLFYGPVDLSDYVEADAVYGVKHNLEHTDDTHHSANDWFTFCTFASDKALADITPEDVHFDHCDWVSDHSGNTWDEGHHDMTALAGSAQVYLAFYFEANNDNPDGGVFVDELLIEGHHADHEVPAPVGFHLDGHELTNGDFSDGLAGWSKETPAGKTGDVTVVDGRAALTGNQLLLHDFEVASETVDLDIHFSYAISTTESNLNTDRFCVSLAPTGNHSAILADVGCWDAASVPAFARDGTRYEVFGYNIPHDLVDDLHGQTVTLVVELIQNDSLPTTLYLDDVVVHSVGITPRDPTSASSQAASTGAVRTVADHLDPNEPNDTNDVATPLACNQHRAGRFGHVLPTVNKDVDVFKLHRVPVGYLLIDVDAHILKPSSSADPVVFLTDAAGTILTEAYHDGKTHDPHLVYHNTVEGATYFVRLLNYNEDGPGAYYTIHAKCGQTDAPPAERPRFDPPTAAANAAGALAPAAWTMILMLNGEDQKCVQANNQAQCWDKSTYEPAIREIEKFIGDKPFMNVVVLLDGPNFGGVASDVTRYVVQPNGNYTLGVNKWELPEVNMGDPKTLVDFANWAIAHYPADHYYLAVDDHGGGMDGSSWDHHGPGGAVIDDQITPAELRSALSQITRNGERKIDIFGFEACLMGLLENAYDLRDYVNYITFFQTVSWTALQYPAYFKDLAATDTPEQLAKRIIQTYPVTSQAYTFGLIQTSQLTTVKTRLDAFANALAGANRTTLFTIRNATQAFRGDPSGDAATDWQGNIDLWDFAQRVKAAGIAVNEATALQTAIDAAVIQKKAVVKVGTDDYSNYHGLTIIYPDGVYMTNLTYCQEYKLSDHGRGGWSNFLATKAYEYTYADYSWDCAGGGAAVQAASMQQPAPRLLHAPRFLEPKLLAEQVVYLPLVAK